MSTRNLDKMMTPRSVVAIGASARPGSLGEAVTRNLLAGGFHGDIHLVNIKGGGIAGRPVLKSLAELKQPADLAVIMTPPADQYGWWSCCPTRSWRAPKPNRCPLPSAITSSFDATASGGCCAACGGAAAWRC